MNILKNDSFPITTTSRAIMVNPIHVNQSCMYLINMDYSSNARDSRSSTDEKILIDESEIDSEEVRVNLEQVIVAISRP